MRFTKIRCLLLLSVGGLCFPAYSSADGAVTRVKNQTLPPGTAATPFIIDRSPMATSADAQLAGFVAAQGAISDYTVEPGGPPLLARIGMAGRQNAAQAGILNAETLTNSINKFQQAFLMPGTVSDTEANGLVKQFFQFAHNAFYDQNTFDKGILGTLFTKSLGRLSPYTTIGKQRAQALPNVPAVNPAAEAEIVRTEKARFDAVSTYLLEQFAKFAYPLQNDVLAIEEQSRWLDKQNDFTTRLTYSNAGLRTDVIGQYQTGTNNGYGAGLRFALDAYKLPPEPIALIPRAHPAPAPPALPKGKAISPVIINDLQADTFTAGAGETFRQASRRAVTGVPLALGTYILRPHFGLAANFQHFNGAGNYYDAGANVSALLPSRIGNRPNAFFYGAGLRYQWFEAEAGAGTNLPPFGQVSGGGSRKGIGGSLVFAFQDNAPHLDDDGTAHLGRWHLRAGVEYAPQNALTRHDYGALFLRLRDRGAGEYTFLLGSEVNGQAFVGFNVSVYFGGPKRRKARAESASTPSLTE